MTTQTVSLKDFPDVFKHGYAYAQLRIKRIEKIEDAIDAEIELVQKKIHELEDKKSEYFFEKNKWEFQLVHIRFKEMENYAKVQLGLSKK